MRRIYYTILALGIVHASYANEPSLTRLPDMNSTRAVHQTTQVSDNEWLITGGCIDAGCDTVSNSTELYQHSAAKFINHIPMNEPRSSHRAIRLDDGDVLLVGGWTGSAATASAERYNHRDKRFTVIANMHSPRMSPAAVKLLNGKVLIAGGERATGSPLTSAEIYDPAQQQFTVVSDMNVARSSHAAAMLADGRVLITGGQRGRNQPLNSAEIFDPVTGRFTLTKPMLSTRYKHAAVTLQDGRVMVLGGSSGGDYQNRLHSTEIFEPKTGVFTAGPSMQHVHFKITHAAVTLPSGEVVIAGGSKHVEKWTPGASVFQEASGVIDAEYAFSTSSLLPNGAVLIVGGYDHRIQPTAGAWLLKP